MTAGEAMRDLRRRRREEAGIPPKLERCEFIIRVTRPGRSPAWEGRVTVEGVQRVAYRSIDRHGLRRAYQDVLHRVAGWLVAAHGEEAAVPVIARLSAAAPGWFEVLNSGGR